MKKVIVSIDLSGSMSGIPVREIEKAVNQFSKWLRTDDGKMIRYCILGFNDSANILCDWNSGEMGGRLCLDAYGGTNITCVLQTIAKIISEEQSQNKAGIERPIVILISDGYINTSSTDSEAIATCTEKCDLHYISVTGKSIDVSAIFPNRKIIDDITSGGSQKILQYMIEAIKGDSRYQQPMAG